MTCAKAAAAQKFSVWSLFDVRKHREKDSYKLIMPAKELMDG